MKILKHSLLLLFANLLFWACSTPPPPPPPKIISEAELESLLKAGAFLVDVRDVEEFATGTAEGAINIPLKTIEANLDKFQGKEYIVVFCKGGVRGDKARILLESKGFTNAFNGGGFQRVDQLIKKIKE
jgi:rhodanese-related sulfurtransferase